MANVSRVDKQRHARPKRSKRAHRLKSAPGLTRRELAEILKTHMQTITKWEASGLPVLERGRKGKPSYYDVAAVRAWVGKRDEDAKQNGTVDVAKERAHRERAQAALAEQTFQMRSRELLPRVEVERVWEAEVIAVRTKLLAIPPTFAERVYQAAVSDGIGGVERMLVESVNDVLRELTDGEEAAIA